MPAVPALRSPPRLARQSPANASGRSGRLARLPVFEPVPGFEPVRDSCGRRVRGSSVRGFSAPQHDVRIDPTCDGHQRQNKDHG
jgi:hypothetical protein